MEPLYLYHEINYDTRMICFDAFCYTWYFLHQNRTSRLFYLLIMTFEVRESHILQASEQVDLESDSITVYTNEPGISDSLDCPDTSVSPQACGAYSSHQQPSPTYS